ncbi:MAG: DNA polymerase III subunit chi [Gammaproteobacteria bacterium]|nr:DNA polymerase III subunit chi [Gammaproteobacteria bacterium]
MTRIDFYILEDNHLLFTCRLAEKIYTQGQRLYIHCSSEQQAAKLDDLLWSFRQGSFIPHALYKSGQQTDLPIHIGHDAEPEAGLDVLINLCQEVPAFFSQFLRIAEIVEPGEPRRQAARERFRFYRDRGYPLESHTIST